MKRIFQIEEQVVEDPATKLRFEFSSVASDAITAGEPCPDYDKVVVMRLWTSTRDRLVTLKFERNGRFIFSQIDIPDQVKAADPDGGVVAAENGDANEIEEVTVAGNEVDVHSVDSTPGLVRAANFG